MMGTSVARLYQDVAKRAVSASSVSRQEAVSNYEVTLQIGRSCDSVRLSAISIRNATGQEIGQRVSCRT